jgi:hypothetical protein
MTGYENIHWLLTALWICYPASVAMGVIARRKLDQIAPDFRKGK